MESVITEEKIPSDTDISFTKEKLNEATSNQAEAQTDAMLDEVAARVDALDFNNVGDVEEPEDPKATVHKQGEIIKKQAETINTLISQLRIMFDEYNDAINEKGYYEDLSEALLRYIEICEGKIQLDQDESETGNSTPRNQDEKEEILGKQDSTALSTETDAPSFSTQSSEQIEGAGATAASTDENTNEKEEATGDSKEKEEEEEKVTISNSELIRLNHILLREIIELRNERDVLRSNIHEYLLSEDDDESPTDEDEDTATDEETHRCEHCTTGNKKSEEDKEEYENRDEQPEMMENKDEHLE